MPDIFLSYTREDQATAQRFAEAFEAQGFSVWWDATLRSGEAYDQVTEKALRTAKAVVVLWSQKSVVSRWVRAEATLAERNSTLVPARIETCDLPIMFELTQTADLTHWKGEADDKAWRAFATDVRRRLGGDEAPAAQAEPTRPPASVAAAGGMPVVAVLPIAARADAKELETFAEDLTGDITRELAHSHYCKVIAASAAAAFGGKPMDARAFGAEAGVGYLVESKLQAAAEEVRLTVQLIDIQSNNMLWSSRFSRNLSEMETSPEEFAVSVAAELNGVLGQFEIRRAMAKPGACSAWEHVLRAKAYQSRQGPDSARRAVKEARAAVAAAPDFGLAHAILALSLSGRLGVDRLLLADAERRDLVRESHEAIKRATQLDGDMPVTLCSLAAAYGSLGDGDAALRLASRAAKLSPNSPEVQNALGFACFMLGRTADAIDAFGRQDRLASLDPSRPFALATFGICQFIEGRLAEAEGAIDRCLALHSDNYLALRWKAIIAAARGKEQEARAAVRLLRDAEPGKSIDEYLDSPRHLPIEHDRKHDAVAILRRLLEDTPE
jgi:TolB-like protein